MFKGGVNMKQVHGIVIYKKSTNTLVCVSAVYKNTSVNLLTDGSTDYNSFDELYTTVLKIFENNNMFVSYTEEFSSRLYDISFINYERPERVNKLYKKGV